MEASDYRELIRSMRISKKLGQNFLINKRVAKTEANFGMDRKVIEMGPGLGILTRELCKVAKSVLAVEKDHALYDYLSGELKGRNLELINDDFFKVPARRLSGFDIMIANIPYNLSSKTLMWLGEKGMPAVLCLQKEFVDHMLAKPDSKDYSRLSVMCALQFTVTPVIDVPANDFYPEPRVSSSVVFLRPKKTKVGRAVLGIITLIMEHKKKKVRNAVLDSEKMLGLTKERAERVLDSLPHSDMRAFQLSPEELLGIARHISRKLKDQNL
ncbi:MAG: 16S rRNA (adenine(1518)-N(6)/adenine(1519)-N(6))-dimethyltransferase RsmA [Candidatus Micrarchaeales archaeon]|nr:16S rRNA (adenine(1518)-N(6)/adenine(1519)-N(6))-dimethyltransferase RsmA [Candidatus Micrarchaeales archaeon]